MKYQNGHHFFIFGVTSNLQVYEINDETIFGEDQISISFFKKELELQIYVKSYAKIVIPLNEQQLHYKLFGENQISII